MRIARCVWGDQGRLQAIGSMIYGGDKSRSASAGAGTGYGTCAWEEEPNKDAWRVEGDVMVAKGRKGRKGRRGEEGVRRF